MFVFVDYVVLEFLHDVDVDVLMMGLVIVFLIVLSMSEFMILFYEYALIC